MLKVHLEPKSLNVIHFEVPKGFSIELTKWTSMVPELILLFIYTFTVSSINPSRPTINLFVTHLSERFCLLMNLCVYSHFALTVILWILINLSCSYMLAFRVNRLYEELIGFKLFARHWLSFKCSFTLKYLTICLIDWSKWYLESWNYFELPMWLICVNVNICVCVNIYSTLELLA